MVLTLKYTQCNSMKKKIIFSLLAIVLCAAILRFYHLSSNPPSLTWDEAAWGYNAYSLGIDGRDEFGRLLPIDYLESFGDFKPPLYAYLDILPVKIFGLTEFATRFPSAFFGVLTVFITFFLTKEIFYSSERKKLYGLAAAGILALSPWHIMLSRAAFEANVATFFLTTGVWLFLKAMRGNSWYVCLSTASFVFAFYTFNSARIVGPLLVVVLGLCYWKKIVNHKMQAACAFLLAIVMLLPSAHFLMTPQAKLRFQEVNIFSDSQVINTSNQEIANDGNSLISKAIHNRRFLYSLSFLRHYFDNFNPNFLFITGDGNPKFSTQDVGELYLFDGIFLISGIFLLLKKREGNWFLILIWLFIGIIPAATARETPHALRIEATLPTFQLLIAYGLVNLFFACKQRVSRIWLNCIEGATLLVLICNVMYFLHGYYVHYPGEFSGEWQYGYKQSIAYVQSVLSTYDQIQVTQALGRPYIYYLFYTKTNPQFFRQNAIVHRDVFGFVDVQSFGKYHFTKTLTRKYQNGKVLFIDTPDVIPEGAHIQHTFYLLNGKPALVAYTR